MFRICFNRCPCASATGTPKTPVNLFHKCKLRKQTHSFYASMSLCSPILFAVMVGHIYNTVSSFENVNLQRFLQEIKPGTQNTRDLLEYQFMLTKKLNHFMQHKTFQFKIVLKFNQLAEGAAHQVTLSHAHAVAVVDD